LGALDLKLRRQMQIELKRIQDEVDTTFVHVTHDQEEAMTMADTVAVMNGGVIEQMGSPQELYEHPHTTFVANFLGQSNLIRGDVRGQEGADVVVQVEGNRLVAPKVRSAEGADQVWVGIRPEKVVLAAPGTAPQNGANVLGGAVVTDASFTGVSTQYLARAPWGQELMVFEQNTGVQKHFSVGDVVDLHWVPDHTFLLDARQDATAGVQREDEEA
ncbi:ABC transporter ATP-binding protein, partial [Nocardioides guangzhouensis]